VIGYRGCASRLKQDLIVADAEMLDQAPHMRDAWLGPPQVPISDLIQRDAHGVSKLAARCTARFAQLLNGSLH
jgi:hypothetical protein